MGVASSDLGWGKHGPKDCQDCDIWGYQPMRTPPQQVWSEFYREGFPPWGRGEILATRGETDVVPLFGNQEETPWICFSRV